MTKRCLFRFIAFTDIKHSRIHLFSRTWEATHEELYTTGKVADMTGPSLNLLRAILWREINDKHEQNTLKPFVFYLVYGTNVNNNNWKVTWSRPPLQKVTSSGPEWGPICQSLWPWRRLWPRTGASSTCSPSPPLLRKKNSQSERDALTKKSLNKQEEQEVPASPP